MIFFYIFAKQKIGVWRSWLAHLHGVQGVVCSSQITPTKQGADNQAPFYYGHVYHVYSLQRKH